MEEGEKKNSEETGEMERWGVEWVGMGVGVKERGE